MDRHVRVAAFTNKNRARSVQDNFDWSAAIIDKIAAEQPDVIALTECFNTRGVGGSVSETAEALDGPTMQLMRAKAREHGCYLIPSFVERRAGLLFNTAVVIDRKGEVAGQYDKIHPTNTEIDAGVVPGRTTPSVIETDFGKIGCQICFDANWPMDWHALKQAGAEIVFFASMYPGGRALNSIATLFHTPIVAANRETCNDIIDCDGLSLARQGVYRDWVIATLNLDSPLFHLDFQFGKLEEIRVKYGKQISVRVYEEEGWWRIYPANEQISVKQIINEFELVTLDAYLAGSTAYQDKARGAARAATA